ncbi:MFS transporter [Bacillus benzoevorans]|uniref:MFS family permease n=1 Tax=Bacillus benzoevorans TaxID=1456 RepID=A0A7X0HPC7_9BACI|nr:MFS transporter [Bacillus benzoevorans]MBB6444378.1 MFS family permease [Bacillus benzoevorans]
MSSSINRHSLLKQTSFGKFWLARVLSSASFQMLSVAIGWQMYDITQDAFSLGFVGLAQFIPMVLLTLFVGQAADRFDRRRIVYISLIIEGLAAVYLLWANLGGWLGRGEILLAAAVIGACRAFEGPTSSALLPQIVSKRILPQAISMNTTGIQTALILGPTVGGLLFAFGAVSVYITAAIALLVSALLTYIIRVERTSPAMAEPITMRSLFLGLEFVFSRPVILGTISLDLFVVLLGGATALMPIFAQDILQTGPWGLGLMRTAPAIGALIVSIFLAYFPLQKAVGLKLFAALAVFGLATMVFALSPNLTVSLIALAFVGGSDCISMVIRSSLVQLQTPDELRGRVNAVNSLFIGTSSQLGEFESGMLAGFTGAKAAAVIGGIGTLAVAGLWMYLFPSIKNLQSLDAESGHQESVKEHVLQK